MSSEAKYVNVQLNLLRVHKSVPWSQMAAEVGISASTIKRFANNETARPQFRTVDLLADYAGFRLAIDHLHLNEPLRLRRIK